VVQSDAANMRRLALIGSILLLVGAPTAASAQTSGAGGDDWLRFELDGPHPFVGLVGLGGPSFVGVRFLGAESITWSDGPLGAGLFAVRGGVYLDRHELALEVSPGTLFWTEGLNGPAVQVIATYAQLVTLHEGADVSIYWPLRIGPGFFTGNTGDNWFLVVRADLLGIALRVGHLVVDLHLPSFRYAVRPADREVVLRDAHVFHWLAGVSASYAF